MLQTRKTTNAALVRAYQLCESVICRPLVSEIEQYAHEWVKSSSNYPEIRTLLIEGICQLSEVSSRDALLLCMSIINDVKSNTVKHMLFKKSFELQKSLEKWDEKVTTLEKMMTIMDGDNYLIDKYQTSFWTDWVDAVKRLSNARARIDAVNRAVGFSKNEEGDIVLTRDDENLRNSASLIITEAISALDDDDAVPTILDLSHIPLPESSAHRDMIENAVLKINTLEDGEDRVHYSSEILDMTDNDLIKSKAAVSILENIDAMPHSSQKLSLLIKAAMTFDPHSELERKAALKWAEVAIQTRLRTSVSMEEIMTEAMQAPDNSFLKEQALQLAISLSAVLLKQQWMSEREKGIRLALAALPFAKDITRLREKAVDILIDNSDAVTKNKERAHFIYDVLAYAEQSSIQAKKGISVLIEASESLTSTTRFKPDEPSENDLRLAYMYRAAQLVADDAENEQAVIQQWLSSLKSLPTRKEKIGHLIKCLKETSRDRLLYTVAWENYDRLIKQEKNETGKSSNSAEIKGNNDDETEKKLLLKVIGE